MTIKYKNQDIKYSIFDPTGNITALVENVTDAGVQPDVAELIMKSHPDVEQVGFVYFEPGRPVPAFLRMAGGEFCGNATMCAASLYLMRSGEETDRVRVRVTGVSHSLEVRLERRSDEEDAFDAGILMPAPLGIDKIKLSQGDITEERVAVKMEGITHIIIEPDSGFYGLKDDKEAAEAAVREWCGILSADCLGLMFLDRTKDDIILIPLVYVPGSGTLFWENSCASGSAACGMYLSYKEGRDVDISLKEPGGTLRVESEAGAERTMLYGTVRKRN